MTTVGEILDETTRQELQQIRIALGDNLAQDGAGSIGYQFLLDRITNSDGTGPISGVPHNVWVWLTQATLINQGLSPLADVIFEYTKLGYRIRTGAELSNAQVIEASNAIAYNFLGEWLVATDLVPTIESTGLNDAGLGRHRSHALRLPGIRRTRQRAPNIRGLDPSRPWRDSA